MSNLIPVKRLDKNGRLVTKHVKPQNAGSSTVNIPAPVAPIPQPFAGGITIPSEVNGIADIWKANKTGRTALPLDSFNPDAVREVNNLISQSKELGRTMGLNYAVGQALELMDEHKIPTGLHNVAVFGDIGLKYGNVDVTQYLTALHELFAPREIDYYLDATEEETKSAKALMELTIYADLEIGTEVVRSSFEDPEEVLEYSELRDPELANFILNNPDRLHEVMDVLKQENGPIPVGVIEARINHTEKSLREGVL